MGEGAAFRKVASPADSETGQIWAVPAEME